MVFSIYNSLSRKVEGFKPLDPPNATLYTCGPTVYDYTHIGHLRKYTGDDLLKRALIYNGYKVKHVQNVTDVGHLASDADEGEDKLEKGAKREGKSVWDVARFYEKDFNDSVGKMNILPPDIICRATENIDAQVDLIKALFQKSFAYETSSAVYFDVGKFKDYGRLSGQDLSEKKVGVRDDVIIDSEKKNPYDFALWVKRVGVHKDHAMHWESPWGDGFPGWHIECSAMSMKYLGDTIDIHTGGVDHIPVHHENEIAQSEGATGKPFVRYWVHHEFLLVDGGKMSKSLNNFYRLKDVKDRGFHPLQLRYLFLNTHYRQKLNFTWDALRGAENSLSHLYELAAAKKAIPENYPEDLRIVNNFNVALLSAVNDDLNIPKALGVFWEMAKHPNVPYVSLIQADKIFGLGFDDFSEVNLRREVPLEILDLAKKRDELRENKEFDEADKIRAEIERKGFVVEDTPSGTQIK
ncbi:cysteine--tRNA ligase [candidate division WWE3 bacterium RIFCSPHIGHO2_01_FULL_40_23]|uniref:Cysteine--tRNA ligase n=1 Tax=candidate division WWE3 bacterium RIFCSPLOWO2_01_FULL_41_18 TaxID=1802625 RepID=A0A1F4VE01_UNCKA|nr:MAG: cysteine--tRNA ligase [candidate division WWE3 bacterium RIFCSPHIGHO2_01_FULL_40_23]OGC55482.1 MAG: cysteine--tRNA ligase [candidate division WWE3 bacterium RIFCSPLOWO2_01_FULL_41_18]